MIAERKGIWRTPEQCDDSAEIVIDQLLAIATAEAWIVDPTVPIEVGRVLDPEGEPVWVATAMVLS